jgi:restriction system protein
MQTHRPRPTAKPSSGTCNGPNSKPPGWLKPPAPPPQRLRIHGVVIASRLTAEATARSAALNSLLESSLSSGTFFHWDILNDHTPFSSSPIVPSRPLPLPSRPSKSRFAARPVLTDKLLPSRRSRKLTSAVHRFDAATAAWRATCLEVAEINRCASAEIQRLRDRRAIQKKLHDTTQLAQHTSITNLKNQFRQHDQHAVEYFFSEVLSRSPYPLGFPRETNLHYVVPTNDLLVEYELPSITAWPNVKEVLYNPVRCTLHNVPVPELWTAVSYEDALFQIPLRVFNELFAHDDAQALDRISFNGWVRPIDKSTGNLAHQCVMSIQIARAEFSAINLARVDPAACFKKLGGTVCRDLADPESVDPLLFRETEAEPFLHTNNFFRSGPTSNLVSIEREHPAFPHPTALPNEA